MPKRAIIVHGWDGWPGEGWQSWLAQQLHAHQFLIQTPAMPDPRHPSISPWVKTLASAVSIPDEHTFLVGHSAGCQTILRYLGNLSLGTEIGGVVLVAPWTELSIDRTWTQEDIATAQPWLHEPLDWKAAKRSGRHFTAIFSDNDTVIPPRNQVTFRRSLDANIILLSGKGHFSGDEGITELPEALDAVLTMAGKKP